MAATLVPNTNYLPEVMAEVGACPRNIALKKILDTLIEVCQETTIWREELATIAVSAGTAVYPLVFNSDQQLAQVNYVYLVDSNSEEVYLVETSEDQLDRESHPSWRVEDGAPTCFYMQDPKNIRFVLNPEEAYTAHIGVFLKPTNDATQAADFIFDHYKDVVTRGAIAKILNMSTRPWYDAAKASTDMVEYEDMKRNIKIAATKSHTRQSKRVVMRPFA